MLKKYSILIFAVIIGVSFVLSTTDSYALDIFGKGKDKSEQPEKKVNIEDLLMRVNSIKQNFKEALFKIIDAQEATLALFDSLESKDEFDKSLKDAEKIEDTAEQWEKINEITVKLNEVIQAKGVKEKLKTGLTAVPQAKKAQEIMNHMKEALKYDKDALNDANLLIPELKAAISSISFGEALSQRENISKLKDASTKLLPFIVKNAPNQIKETTELASLFAESVKTVASAGSGKGKKPSKGKK